MVEELVSYGPSYLVYLLELGLFVVLLRQGRWTRLRAAFLYIALLLAIDAVGRPYVLFRYGVHSREYGYFFWLTDVLLALLAFAVVCSFFRRACTREEKMWRFLRLMLAFILLLVVGITATSLSRNYSHLFTFRFIIEFQQNLYFTCLVLNTLLYLLMQQLDSADDQLGLLVCGMGIQFAGPAAGLALAHLTPGLRIAQSLWTYLHPLCTIGMVLTWLYAVSKAEEPVLETVAGEPGMLPAFADVPLPGARRS